MLGELDLSMKPTTQDRRAEEPDSDQEQHLTQIGRRWRVEPLAFPAGLRFGPDCHRALRNYGRGYVKEGGGGAGSRINGRPVVQSTTSSECSSSGLGSAGSASRWRACSSR
jgi:hypothetical protein